MLVLSRSDIASLISMREAIGLMRMVFPEVTRQKIVAPMRQVLAPGNDKNAVLFMPGYVPRCEGLGIKIVSVFPENTGRGIPTISALIVLNSTETGQVLSVMDGGFITALRTGATSGLATDLLARKDAHCLGVFGSGVQSRTQIAAILAVRAIQEVVIYDPIPEHSRVLIHDLESTYQVKWSIADAPEALVRKADVIVTATTSATPVFDGRRLNAGTHINSIGSFKPDVREVDDHTVRQAKIVVDAYEACLSEAGDLLMPMNAGVIDRSDICAELGELVLNQKTVRESDDDITYFKSVGMSAQDIIVARTAYDKACQQGIGQEFPKF